MEANLFSLLHTASLEVVKEQVAINAKVIHTYKKLGITNDDQSMKDLLENQKELQKRLTELENKNEHQ